MTDSAAVSIIAAMGQPRSHDVRTIALLLAALAFGLAGCAGEPAPVMAPPPAKVVPPKARGEPTLGDVVKEIESRRRVIKKLKEIEKDEP